eukprot:15363196-Ditylum_brightwellii.AAC.1
MNDSLSPELDQLFKSQYDEDEMNISHVKILILKDFLARLPYMLEKASTVDNAVDGFVDVEWMQRSKEITHGYQHQLRQKEELQQQFYESAAKVREYIEGLLETNQAAEEIIIMQIKENNKNSEENPS